jgi:hypothetical protein
LHFSNWGAEETGRIMLRLQAFRKLNSTVNEELEFSYLRNK